MKKILLATNGTDHSARALAFGTDLAVKYGAEVLLLHVVKESGVPQEIKEYISAEEIAEPPEAVFLEIVGKNIINKCRAECVNGGVNNIQTIVLKGDPATKIIQTAEEHEVEAIILGSHSEDALLGRLIGSVTRKVLHAAPCTCIIVK